MSVSDRALAEEIARSRQLAQERDQARRLARWLFERTGFPTQPSLPDQLLHDHPWLARDHPDLP